MKNKFVYTNPIQSPAIPAIRDPQIIPYDGKYYLVGTAPPFWNNDAQGVPLYVSSDLLNWEFVNWLIRRDELPLDVWYRDRFWAPEILIKDGRFYLTFNCRNEATGAGHGAGMAVADRIEGPYRVLTPDGPFWVGNDVSLFEDDDGRPYAFIASWNPATRGIAGCAVDLDNAKLIGTPVCCVPKTDAIWQKAGIEGPFVVKRAGIYYLFYSSWTRGYEIGYATARHPLGPWTIAEENPIFGSRDAVFCAGYSRMNKLGITTEDSPDPFCEVGHNTVFVGPDGRDWICAHYHPSGNELVSTPGGNCYYADSNPMLGFDRLEIGGGKVRTTGPTWTEQVVEWDEEPGRR